MFVHAKNTVSKCVSNKLGGSTHHAPWSCLLGVVCVFVCVCVCFFFVSLQYKHTNNKNKWARGRRRFFFAILYFFDIRVQEKPARSARVRSWGGLRPPDPLPGGLRSPEPLVNGTALGRKTFYRFAEWCLTTVARGGFLNCWFWTPTIPKIRAERTPFFIVVMCYYYCQD